MVDRQVVTPIRTLIHLGDRLCLRLVRRIYSAPFFIPNQRSSFEVTRNNLDELGQRFRDEFTASIVVPHCDYLAVDAAFSRLHVNA